MPGAWRGLATYYNANSNYGFMGASDPRHIKGLGEESDRLQRMSADLRLIHEATKEFTKRRVGNVGAL